MKHFLLEDREYKMDIRYKAPGRRNERPLYLLRKLLNNKGRSFSGGRSRDTRQMCVVKMHYSKSIKAHRVQLDKYLIREGAGKEGGRAEIYGTPEEEYRKNMAAKNFRIFLSPQSDKVDLRVLTENFVKKLEVETGYKFYWQAAEHYNTAHPHAHLLINGTGKTGEDVIIKKDIVKRFMRELARDTCTSLTGSRTRDEMEADRNKNITANRLTEIDRDIDIFSIEKYISPKSLNKRDSKYARRLEYLRTLGLCERENDGYRLENNWLEILKTQGRYNCYLDAQNNLQYSGKQDFTLYESGTGKQKGIITKIYKVDDVSDNYAAVMEGINGKAYFIPLYKRPEIKAGDMVEAVPLKNQKGRLTPVFNTLTKNQTVYHIKRNNYKNRLADSLLEGIDGKGF
ncbi:hypothetical protein FACS1894190_07160 [Spirochaetia bacterium]|nr:hypothetical protein FACS1894190_07160 [Spirochaetia bacterium]